MKSHEERVELAELAKIAKAATQGEWSITEHGDIIGGETAYYIVHSAGNPLNPAIAADLAHIAAASPDVVLSLLAQIEQLETERDTCSELLDQLQKATLTSSWAEAVKRGSDQGLGTQPFNHPDGSECPTFYDGCNCTLQALSEAFDREDAAVASHNDVLSECKRLRDLVHEAADSVHASLAETDISDERRRYRLNLEARLRKALEEK